MKPKRKPDPGRYSGQIRPKFSQLHEDRDLLWITPLPVRYFVAIVGYRTSGKSLVATYLSDKKGFELFSLSSIVRDRAERRGQALGNRSELQALGDELRAQAFLGVEDGEPEFGDGGYFARLLLRRIRSHYHSHRAAQLAPRIALAGFKHPDELAVVAQLKEFAVLLVEPRDQGQPEDAEAELEVRAMHAWRTGGLASELEALGELVELSKLPPAPALGSGEENLSAKERKAILTTYREKIDEPDRISSTRETWIGSYGQAVERVVAGARKMEETIPIYNGPKTTLSDLHRQLDQAVDKLDHKFRDQTP
jgi:hypothetical protein